MLVYSPGQGEYVSALSMGQTGSPLDYANQSAPATLAVMLLLGQLEAASSSYFHAKWVGDMATTIVSDDRVVEFERNTQCTNISTAVLMSLRSLPRYRHMVPEPQQTFMDTAAQMLMISVGGSRYLDTGGMWLPLDMVEHLFAPAGIRPPSGADERKAALEGVMNKLLEGQEQVSVKDVKEKWGTKLVRLGAEEPVEVPNSLCELDVDLEVSGVPKALSIRLDALKGTSYAEILEAIGGPPAGSYHQHLTHWG